MTTGQLIRTHREQLGISVHVAADKANVARRAWYQLEADENSPTVRTLEKIAIALGQDTRDLVPPPAPETP